jgi:enoyl-[acyl-carrier protein] reductase I
MDIPVPAAAELPRVLPGHKALVTGVANEHSIAWGCAQALRKAGGMAMAYVNEKTRTYTEPLAQKIEAPIFMPLQVHDTAQMDAVFERIGAEWGRLDTLIHSIAFAPKEALQSRVTDCQRDGFLTAMELSCWSFIDLARRSEKLMRQGGTMITMTYLGANRVVENYGIMGPVKAALESATRYMPPSSGRRASVCTRSVPVRWPRAPRQASATSTS